MHLFLDAVFQAVVLGIAIVLLVASLELRNAGRGRNALAHSDLDDDQVRRANARVVSCRAQLH